MQVTIKSKSQLKVGGPKNPTVVATFEVGEKLTLKCISADGAYPVVYVIEERPDVGELTRGQLRSFLDI